MDKARIKNIVREVLNEIKINNPNKLYYIKEFYKDYLGEDYDDLREELGEDLADAITQFDDIRQGNNLFITDQNIKKYLEEEDYAEHWDKLSLLTFLDNIGILK